MTQLEITKNPKWPYFQWVSSELIDSLSLARFSQGWLAAKQEELQPSQVTLDLQHLLSPADQDKFQPLFIWWKNAPVALDPIIRAGIAFLWIYLIQHDLNLAAAAVEVSLQKDDFFLFSKDRFLKQLQNLSLEMNKAIEKCHNPNSDITAWLQFFIKNLTDNFIETKFILKKISLANLNSRQKYVISALVKNQEHFLTNKKYLELTFTSRESAKRDLKQLLDLGLLKNNGTKGRGVMYSLKN